MGVPTRGRSSPSRPEPPVTRSRSSVFCARPTRKAGSTSSAGGSSTTASSPRSPRPSPTCRPSSASHSGSPTQPWLRGEVCARGRGLCRVEGDAGRRSRSSDGHRFPGRAERRPDLFHVVASLVGEGPDAPKPRSERQLRVRFDHATGRRTPSSTGCPRHGWSPRAVRTPPRSRPRRSSRNWSPSRRCRPPRGARLRGHRSRGLTGVEHGYYDLQNTIKPSGNKIHLFQASPGACSSGQPPAPSRACTTRPGGTRRPHPRTRSIGSSGRLLLDSDHTLLSAAARVARPTRGRRRHLGRHDHDDVLAQGRRERAGLNMRAGLRVLDDSRPILGTSTCREWSAAPPSA